VFFGEVIKGDEILPVPLQAGGGRRLAQTTQSGVQGIPTTFALLARGRLGECPQFRADLRLKAFGQFVEHVQRSMIPAPLMARGGKDLVKRRPQPQRAIANRQQRCLRESAFFE
jgi:hypothetical protein